MCRLSNGRQLLLRAKAEGIFIPAFNIYNLETIQAALAASEHNQRPVILAFGAGYLANATFAVIYAIAETLVRQHTQEVVLHLDHCRDLQLIHLALDAGFTSVMFDGSHLPFQENKRLTKIAKALAQPYGACVEGELGGLNSEIGATDVDTLVNTDPTLAKQFALETGVDSLAVSIGNAHGKYRGKPCLNMELLETINAQVGLPLVLHGSSGIPLPILKQAATHGIAKININTDIATAGADAARTMPAIPGSNRLEHIMLTVREQMRKVMEGYFYH